MSRVALFWQAYLFPAYGEQTAMAEKTFWWISVNKKKLDGFDDENSVETVFQVWYKTTM